MKGTIAIEEAIVDRGFVNTLAQYQKLLTPGAPTAASLSAHEQRLLDIHGQRLKTMDEEGVEYMLLSLTSPGCQGESDIRVAEQRSRDANDYLAEQVRRNPARLGALAALSMHNPIQAREELRRAVKDLGMFGGLVNDFQSAGEEGELKFYYDTAIYAPF